MRAAQVALRVLLDEILERDDRAPVVADAALAPLPRSARLGAGIDGDNRRGTRGGAAAAPAAGARLPRRRRAAGASPRARRCPAARTAHARIEIRYVALALLVFSTLLLRTWPRSLFISSFNASIWLKRSRALALNAFFHLVEPRVDRLLLRA